MCLLLPGGVGGGRSSGRGRGIFPAPLNHISHPSDPLPGVEEMTEGRMEGISGEGLDQCFETICITKLLTKSG